MVEKETPLHLLPCPSQSYSRRFPMDQKLRRCGFRIEHRPKTGEPIWSLDGVEYTQSQAVEYMERQG